MIYKLALKDFKKNIASYTPLFLSFLISTVFMEIILTVAMMGMSGVLSGDLTQTILIVLLIHIIITAMVLNYTLNHYMKTRSKSYKVYMVLGMKESVLKKILFMEYCCGGAIAILAGFGIGILAVTALIREIQSYYTLEVIDFSVGKHVRIAVVLCVIISLLVMFCNYKICGERDISINVQVKKRRFRITNVKKQKYILFVSMLLVLTGILMQATVLANIRYLNPLGVVLSSIGYIILFYVGVEYVLIKLRKKKAFHPKMISITNYLKQFQSNQMMLCTLFLIHFSLFTVFFVQLVGALPTSEKTYDSVYPYDLVWYDAKVDEQLIAEIYDKVELSKPISYVLLKSKETSGYYIGISEKTYNELSWQGIHLEEKQIHTVSQGRGQIFYNSTARLSIVDKVDEKTYHKEEEFTVKGWENQFLLGLAFDDIVVFSDNQFDSYMKGKQNKVMLAQDIVDSEKGQVVTELLKENKMLDSLNRSGVCIKPLEIQKNVMEQGVSFIIMVVFVLSFVLYGLYFTGVKVWNQIPVWQEQNRHLECLGMKGKEREKSIYREIKMFVYLPFIFALLCSIPYVIFKTILWGKGVRDYESFLNMWYVVFLLIAASLIINTIYYLYLKQTVNRQIEQ